MAQITVGFIGAGQLGEPTAERIISAGFPVRLFARRHEVRQRLQRRGATAVDAAREVADAGIVVLFLFSDGQVLDVALGTEGVVAAMRGGSTLVVHTTTSVQTVGVLAAAAAERGVHVVDAPVSGTADDIRSGRLTVLAGGDEAPVARCTEVFRAYADTVLATGALGTAMKVKLVNNLLFAANVQLVADAARLARQLGVEPMRALQAMASCSSASNALSHLLLVGGVDEFAARIAPYLRKDVAAGQDAASQLSGDLGLLGAVARDGPLDIA